MLSLSLRCQYTFTVILCLFQKLEEEVFRCRQEVLEAQCRSAALSLECSSVDQKVTDKEQQLCQLK